MGKNLIRAIAHEGGVIVCAVDSTNIVSRMEKIHNTSAVASAALGRVLTAASLMGAWLKNTQDSLTLRVSGGGEIGTLLAVSDGSGNVRGYADNPVAEAPLREDGKLNVGYVVGKEGLLSVVRDLGLKEPYIGQIELVSGEIAEDIVAYYAISEQTPTACALGVLVNKDLSIKKAGGILIQLMPGATEEEIALLEKNIAKMPSITKLLEDGASTEDIMNVAMEGFNPDILEESSVEYKCYCNEEKTERILISLGIEELESLKVENDFAQVECHFCETKYNISVANLLEELAE